MANWLGWDFSSRSDRGTNSAEGDYTVTEVAITGETAPGSGIYRAVYTIKSKRDPSVREEATVYGPLGEILKAAGNATSNVEGHERARWSSKGKTRHWSREDNEGDEGPSGTGPGPGSSGGGSGHGGGGWNSGGYGSSGMGSGSGR